MGLMDLAGTALGAGGNVAAGREQRKYLNASMNQLKNANQQAAGFQQPIYDQSKQAFGGLQRSLSGGDFDMGKQSAYQPDKFNFDFKADPGYQFALGQGIDAVKNQGAAGGMAHSPQTGKALIDYATGMANQQYGDVYNRERGAFEDNRNFGYNAQNQAWNQNFQNTGRNFEQQNQLIQPYLMPTANNLSAGANTLGQNLATIEQQKGNVSAQIAATPYMAGQAALGQLSGPAKMIPGYGQLM